MTKYTTHHHYGDPFASYLCWCPLPGFHVLCFLFTLSFWYTILPSSFLTKIMWKGNTVKACMSDFFPENHYYLSFTLGWQINVQPQKFEGRAPLSSSFYYFCWHGQSSSPWSFLYMTCFVLPSGNLWNLSLSTGLWNFILRGILEGRQNQQDFRNEEK